MDILEALRERGGYWKYEGGRYLAKLTSGKVSDVYVNCSKITGNTPIMEAASFGLLCKLRGQISADRKIAKGIKPCRDLVDWLGDSVYVCGPAFGGITLAYSIALGIGAEAIFTEKVEYAPSMLETDSRSEAMQKTVTGQQLKRFEIPEGATVLFVEDVITTGKSTREMIHASYESLMPRVCQDSIPPDALVHALPYILCLVNRSGLDEIELGTPYDGEKYNERKFKIISLADVQARVWDSVEKAEAVLEQEYCKRSGGRYVTDLSGNQTYLRPRLDDGVGPRPVNPMEAVRSNQDTLNEGPRGAEHTTIISLETNDED